jgi:hypothetical protein
MIIEYVEFRLAWGEEKPLYQVRYRRSRIGWRYEVTIGGGLITSGFQTIPPSIETASQVIPEDIFKYR